MFCHYVTAGCDADKYCLLMSYLNFSAKPSIPRHVIKYRLLELRVFFFAGLAAFLAHRVLADYKNGLFAYLCCRIKSKCRLMMKQYNNPVAISINTRAVNVDCEAESVLGCRRPSPYGLSH